MLMRSGGGIDQNAAPPPFGGLEVSIRALGNDLGTEVERKGSVAHRGRSRRTAQLVKHLCGGKEPRPASNRCASWP